MRCRPNCLRRLKVPWLLPDWRRVWEGGGALSRTGRSWLSRLGQSLRGPPYLPGTANHTSIDNINKHIYICNMHTSTCKHAYTHTNIGTQAHTYRQLTYTQVHTCTYYIYNMHTHTYTQYTHHAYTHINTCIYNIHYMHTHMHIQNTQHAHMYMQYITCICNICTYMHTYTTDSTCIHTHTFATYPICIKYILETRDIYTPRPSHI